MFSFYVCCDTVHRNLHSFPTRRSSDLCFHFALIFASERTGRLRRLWEVVPYVVAIPIFVETLANELQRLDRKSTRLNSSHGYISYAVFCLKKKKDQKSRVPPESTDSGR